MSSAVEDIDLAMLPSLPLTDRKRLPSTPAIYFVIAEDAVLYIGQSISLNQRWIAHHRLDQLNEYANCRRSSVYRALRADSQRSRQTDR